MYSRLVTRTIFTGNSLPASVVNGGPELLPRFEHGSKRDNISIICFRGCSCLTHTAAHPTVTVLRIEGRRHLPNSDRKSARSVHQTLCCLHFPPIGLNHMNEEVSIACWEAPKLSLVASPFHRTCRLRLRVNHQIAQQVSRESGRVLGLSLLAQRVLCVCSGSRALGSLVFVVSVVADAEWVREVESSSTAECSNVARKCRDTERDTLDLWAWNSDNLSSKSCIAAHFK
ncbi:hypothetical protein DFS34DRAFT_141249 [Phlyctochytrium arcticum]|nr:hypothetical protein DFS34DRAFT_141249 [Phlyctochytrium arcticum]